MGALESSLERVLADCFPNPKVFWASSAELPLGVGLVFSDVVYPLIDIDTGRYDTVSGTVMVLTHECDVSQENDRYLNEELLICPLTPFGDFIQTYIEDFSDDSFINGFLPALSKNLVNRAMYLPPINTECLPHGGLINLNQICSTHISTFQDKKAVATTSAMGLERIDLKMRNHLFRPKAANLPGTHLFLPRTPHIH